MKNSHFTENAQEAKEGLAIKPFPERIVIELSAGCNLSCPMCPRRYLKLKNGFIDNGLWVDLVDEIAQKFPHVTLIPFWRGEPTMHPEFIKLMQYAISKTLHIHISTNGHFLNEESKGVLTQLDLVTFSIHTSEGYINAKSFIRARHRGKPIVQVSFVRGEVTTGVFLDELINSPDLCGFDSVRLYEEHSKYGVFGKSKLNNQSCRSFCPKLSDTLVIAFDGSVSRCNHIWKTEMGLNIKNNGILNIWHSEPLEKIRKNYPDCSCLACDQWIGHTLGESWRSINGIIKHEVFGKL